MCIITLYTLWRFKLVKNENIFFYRSTIGYGDIAPQTTLGRIFCCFFVVGALVRLLWVYVPNFVQCWILQAFFTSTIPEVYKLVSNRKQYKGSYKLERGTGHIVVGGHITYKTMSKILDDFHQKDWNQKDLKVVFVSTWVQWYWGLVITEQAPVHVLVFCTDVEMTYLEYMRWSVPVTAPASKLRSTLFLEDLRN